MGFTMATHYCGGHAVETALVIDEAHIDCGMESEEEPCANPVVKSNNCCENENLNEY